MVPFGIATRVLGTPAFISPEALNHQPLDQRTDLYALGALAYWLMTKRYAYRAHFMAHLHDAWRSQPTPLSALVPEAPKRLNDLVMSLLSLDRMARPFCAFEVVETLEACAGLEPDDTIEVKQAYLTAPQLVALALQSQERAFLLAVTLEEAGATPLATSACTLISHVARRIHVDLLDSEATEELLRSGFGVGPDRVRGVVGAYRRSKNDGGCGFPNG